MSAAEGWSDEAFRAGRRTNETTEETSSFVELLDRDVSFERATGDNPTEVTVKTSDRLSDGLKVTGNKVSSFACNVFNYAITFIEFLRFIKVPVCEKLGTEKLFESPDDRFCLGVVIQKAKIIVDS